MTKTACAIALLLGLRVPSFAADKAVNEFRAAAERGYKRMNTAYETKNISQLEKLFAPSCKFKQRSEGAIIGTRQFIAGTKGLLAITHVKRSTTRILKVAPVKAGYEVTTVWSGESWLTRDIQTGKATKPRPRKTEQTMRDTWSRTPDGWRITARLIDS